MGSERGIDGMTRLVLIFLMTAQAYGGLDAKSGKVINVATPTAATDAANKQYVDDTASAEGHNLLSSAHGDAATDAVTRGSIIYGNSTPAWDELDLGASGTVLRSDGTDAGWSATTSITALGTIVTGTWNATAIDISDYTNLAVGTGITLTDDTLTTNDGEIDHDALNNFAAGEHIDWTNASSNFKTSGTFILTTTKTPSGPSDIGTAGHIAWDADHIYACVAANTWKRAALSSWTDTMIFENGDTMIFENGDTMIFE